MVFALMTSPSSLEEDAGAGRRETHAAVGRGLLLGSRCGEPEDGAADQRGRARAVGDSGAGARGARIVAERDALLRAQVRVIRAVIARVVVLRLRHRDEDGSEREP